MKAEAEVCASVRQRRFEEQEKAFTIDRNWHGRPIQRNGWRADDLRNTPRELLVSD